MGILIKNNIVNQKGTPAFYESSLATRPVANIQGRMFIDTDNPSTGIYRDNGSSWNQVADPGAGTTGNLQQVTTNGSTTNVGITITNNGLNTNNLVLNPNIGIIKTTAISQIMGVNDLYEIYGIGTNTTGLGESELVFSLGDDGQPYATGGERFRFTYGSNIIVGTPKDVFIIDYNLSYFNTNVGINTPTPSSPFDIHTATGINATFNGTGTTNSALQFQLAGTGKWNIGNLYNAAANDFIITDVTNTINRLTIKNTGQLFIGTDVTSSGALVVNNATSDNHIVCIGANAPSIRLRNTGTLPSLNVGLGISTATNNFIQGSVSGDYCIFNSSTTASPILFGIYDAGTGKTQEAARITAARNFLIGTTTDSGYKISVSGTANISGNVFFGGQLNTTTFTSVNSSSPTTIATGVSFIAIIRNRGSGGTAIILYDNGSSPSINIISQTGTAQFVLTAPLPTQIQFANGGNLVTALTGSSVGTTNLNITVITNQT